LTQLAEALVGAVAQTTAGIADASARPSLSVGLCYFDAAPEDAAGLVSRAAKACAAARSAGGGRVEVYRSPAVESDAIETPNLPELIRSALQKNGFQVLFQPFVNLKDTECESYEMMLRLRSGDGDQISAGEFLPAAKLEGLSCDIDRWICRQALDVMVERRQTGNETKLLIAQTADTLVDGSGIDWLRDELRRRQLIGTGLILEFNLVDVANNLKASKALIGQLKEMGIAVCLARFGHNDASYKLLNFLGAGYVKVVEKLLKAETRIIANLVERLHELNTQVIVPRVDDPRLIGQQWLSGADYVQGNAIQRPAESADYDFSERL